jgi:hypothetical protein
LVQKSNSSSAYSIHNDTISMQLYRSNKVLLAFAVFSQALTAVHGFAPAGRGFRAFLGSGGVVQHMASGSNFEYALLFDCDGVILETEGEK